MSAGPFHVEPRNILILPGWQNSGPDHWQSRWEALHGHRRVEQHDWMAPKRGDWIARLEDVILGTDGPVVLVAPGDAEREELRTALPSWSPIVRERLPFPSILVGSRDDPYCSFERAQGLAYDWGARFIDLGERGHINAESGLGDWPEGRALLLDWTGSQD